MDADESTPSVQALGSATYGACQHVLQFSKEVVGPIIYARTARNPMFAPMAVRAMFDRIHGWLITFDSLNNPAHFQAVLSGGDDHAETRRFDRADHDRSGAETRHTPEPG